MLHPHPQTGQQLTSVKRTPHQHLLARTLKMPARPSSTANPESFAKVKMEQTLEMKIEGICVIPLCGVNLETYKYIINGDPTRPSSKLQYNLVDTYLYIF